MTDKPDDGGYAFPKPFVPGGSESHGGGGSMWISQPGYSGMTLRQYAAIQLRVPDSGLAWLDKMIEKSRL